jgi:hypothetical protein
VFCRCFLDVFSYLTGHRVQNSSGAHPASYLMGTRGYSGRGVKLTTHLHLVSRSKNSWGYTSTPQYTLMAWCSVKKITVTSLPLSYWHWFRFSNGCMKTFLFTTVDVEYDSGTHPSSCPLGTEDTSIKTTVTWIRPCLSSVIDIYLFVGYLSICITLRD